MSRVLILLMSSLLMTGTARATTPTGPSPWSIQLSGTAQHFEQPKGEHRRWNQENWGIGLQYEEKSPTSAWSTAYSAGTMKDSYGVNGGYVAAARYHELLRAGRLQAKAGVSLFGLWRGKSWEGDRHFMLAPLPVFQVEDVPTGYGLNAVLSPRASFNGRKLPGFVFFQLTKRF